MRTERQRQYQRDYRDRVLTYATDVDWSPRVTDDGTILFLFHREHPQRGRHWVRKRDQDFVRAALTARGAL